MTWTDLFLTPIYLLVFYLFAFLIKPHVTDRNTAKYFIPGYTVKIIGAIAVGLIYQFYYGGGDTFVFYEDSTFIYNLLLKDPSMGIKLLFSSSSQDPNLHLLVSRMHHYGDTSSFFVIKLAAILSLISFNNYTVIACMFATISYSGLWSLYRAFYYLYPHVYKLLAYSVLFIPSVFFWGSGYLKDTITLGAVGWAFYCLIEIFIRKRSIPFNIIIFLIASYVLYKVKIYILLCMLPGIIFWIVSRSTATIKSNLVRYGLAPFVIIISGVLGFYAVQKVGESDSRYSLEAVAVTAEETARWLSYLSEIQGGSIYTLGDFDYSTAGMIRKALPAVNVTLFRPYVWEAHNVVMLLSALESLLLLLFTLYVIYKKGLMGFFKAIKNDPTIAFCLIFAISFSFAIGISTYNFGSLVRYKIPMLPFYLVAMIVILKPQARRVVKRRRKLVRLADTENSPSMRSRANFPI